MGRAQDTLALLRALKLVADATAKTQGDYARHLWANSSVRELLEQQLRQGEDAVKKVLQDPNKGLEDASSALKETIERTAVVVEGLKQLAIISLPKGMPARGPINFGTGTFSGTTAEAKTTEKGSPEIGKFS